MIKDLPAPHKVQELCQVLEWSITWEDSYQTYHACGQSNEWIT